ncbi:MAG: hypothetical protein HY776_01665 [Actinobacteria bacterium]|nr:hypothetical protein [Actinomycetota bacterium]
MDDESGLYYFGTRYYDSETGRFITKDPDGGDVTDPQSLNPYVYVRNNPVNLVDPDGQVVEATIAASVGGVMMFVTSPAWAPTAGLVLVAGGLTAIATDYYLSLKQAKETGKQLAIQYLKRKIERYEGTFTPQELQKMGIIPSNKQLKKNGLTNKDLHKLGLTVKKKSDKKK